MAVNEKTVYEAPADLGNTGCIELVDAPAPSLENTTSDGRYRFGRQIEFDPPFTVYEGIELRTGKPVTVLRILSEDGRKEVFNQMLLKRYVHSIHAATGRETGENCPFIAIWWDPAFRQSSPLSSTGRWMILANFITVAQRIFGEIWQKRIGGGDSNDLLPQRVVHFE